ncbi:MAG: hypothetical protein HQL58_13895, partial [Magnetococcales bacterium]|nr:hypothetical protein [Magnetococcales bacterium]
MSDTTLSAPVVASLASEDDSGWSSSDRVTRNDSALTITGSGDSGALLALFEDRDGNSQLDENEQIGTALVTTAGVWSCDISLSEGSHTLVARQTLADVTSSSSGSLVITVDQSAPDMTGGPDLNATSDSGRVSYDDITNVTSGLTVSGSGAVAGTLLTLFNDTNWNELVDSGEWVSSLAITTAGAWSMTGVVLTEGTYALRTIQSDLAGNNSRGSDILSLTVDTAAPQAITAMRLDGGDDSGVSDSDGITSRSSELTLMGRGEEGALVTLTNAVSGSVLATMSVQDGEWHGDIALATGSYTLAAVQTDRAGNQSQAATLLVTVDSSSPAAPSLPDLESAGDSGVSNSDNITSATTALTLQGSGEAGAIVTLMDGGEWLGTVAVTAEGRWSSSLTPGEKDLHIRAYQTDLAGNNSGMSAVLDMTVDRSAPSTPGNLY